MSDEKKTQTREVRAGVTVLRKLESGALSSNALEKEDVFTKYYELGSRGTQLPPIKPPYLPHQLRLLTQQNNTLNPCIEAMVVNVHGTSHTITTRDPQASLETKIKEVEDFFSRVSPNQTFLSVRKAIGRDIESVGFGFLEVIRSGENIIRMLRRVDPDHMRYVRLGDAVPTTVEMPNGRVKINHRPRLFAQVVGSELVYFKSFGETRHLNKDTGVWSDKALPLKDRATEIIAFSCVPDAETPYGVPKWISNLPSVLGSRKAEELNLEFFDNGGIPPILLLLSGGAFTEDSKDYLTNLFSGKASSKQTAAIVEAIPVGGSFDKPSTVKLEVERFGSEKQNDSMFENYDKRCHERVRMSWRLPELFLGKTDSMTYATAYASYTLAEAQVFRPERDEFDTVINSTLMREIGGGDLVFKSKPINAKHIEFQLKALELLSTSQAITKQQLVESTNEVTDLDIDYDASVENTPSEPPEPPVTSEPGTPDVQENVAKSDFFNVRELALRFTDSLLSADNETLKTLKQEVDALTGAEESLFCKLVAKMVVGEDSSAEDLGSLVTLASEHMADE